MSGSSLIPTNLRWEYDNNMDFVYRRNYRGKLKAVILDWAGTTMDATHQLLFSLRYINEKESLFQ